MLDLKTSFSEPSFNILKKVEPVTDYFKGNWYGCPVFLKNLVNYDLLTDNYSYWTNIIKVLKDIQVIATGLHYFIGEATVYPHTDTDLVNNSNLTRIFYPLTDNNFYFKGYVVNSDGSIQNKEIIDNKPVIFLAQKEHEFKNYSNSYYLMIDVAKNINELDSDFWSEYLTFIIKHYVS